MWVRAAYSQSLKSHGFDITIFFSRFISRVCLCLFTDRREAQLSMLLDVDSDVWSAGMFRVAANCIIIVFCVSCVHFGG